MSSTGFENQSSCSNSQEAEALPYPLRIIQSYIHRSLRTSIDNTLHFLVRHTDSALARSILPKPHPLHFSFTSRQDMIPSISGVINTLTDPLVAEMSIVTPLCSSVTRLLNLISFVLYSRCTFRHIHRLYARMVSSSYAIGKSLLLIYAYTAKLVSVASLSLPFSFSFLNCSITSFSMPI